VILQTERKITAQSGEESSDGVLGHGLLTGRAGWEAAPEQQSLPQVRSPQVRVVSWYRVLLPPPGADEELVVRLDGNDPPELLD